MAIQYFTVIVLFHLGCCITLKHDDQIENVPAISVAPITVVPTNSYASMEDQIAAVFNKVAYESASFSPTAESPTPTSSTPSTTQKVFINSPKIITGYSGRSRPSLDLPRPPSLPTITAFPPIEWFTKENFPLVRLNITSPPPVKRNPSNNPVTIVTTLRSTAVNNPVTKSNGIENLSDQSSTRSPFSLLEDNFEEDSLPSDSTYESKSFVIPTIEISFQPSTNSDKNTAIRRENETYPNDDPFVKAPQYDRDPENSHPLNNKPEVQSGLEEWGVAWELHVYVVGSLFLLIGVYSITSLFCLKSSTRVVPNEYFVLINSLVFILSISKAVTFFFDPYNMKHAYSPIVSNIMANIIYPCLTSSLFILLVCLLRVTKVPICSNSTTNALGLFLYIVFTFGLSITCDILYGLMPTFPSSYLVNRVNTILNLVIFSVITFFYYKRMLREGFKLKTSMMIERYSKLHIRGNTLPKKLPCLGLVLAVKVSLSIALFSCLLAALLVYGNFAQFHLFGNVSLSPWQWWIYQFSMRILEIILACLLAFVSSLRLGDNNNDSNNEASCAPSRIFSIMSCSQATCPDDVNDVEIGTRSPVPSSVPHVETECPSGVQQVYSLRTSNTLSTQQKKKKLPRKTNVNNAVPFYQYDSQPPSDVINTSRGVIPREVVEQCMNFIPPHVYEELYYHVSNKKTMDGHEYASLTYDTTVKSAMQGHEASNFSEAKNSKFNPLRNPILSSEWLSGRSEVFDRSLTDECFSYPPSRENVSVFDICSLSKMGSTCSSQSAAHSFDVQLFLSPQHIISNNSPETPGPFRSLGQHEGITSFINSSNNSSSDRMGDHVLSPFKRPLPPIPKNCHSTPFSPGTLSCGSRRDRRIEWILGEGNFLGGKGKVRSLYDGSDSDVFSSVGLTSSGEASHEESLSKTPTSHLQCRYPGLQLNLKQHSDLFLPGNKRDPKSKDITPDSAVVVDMKDSPFHQNYPIYLSSRTINSSSNSDIAKDRLRKSSLSRVSRQKSFKSSDLTLAKRASRNLLHKIKGSNFSLNSNYHGYSPLNSDELNNESHLKMKRCVSSEYEVELSASDLKVTISSNSDRAKSMATSEQNETSTDRDARPQSSYHIELAENPSINRNGSQHLV